MVNANKECWSVVKEEVIPRDGRGGIKDLGALRLRLGSREVSAGPCAVKGMGGPS